MDEALDLTTLARSVLSDSRKGKNTRHSLTALLRQSVYSRLAGYEDTNDAERLCVDPAMRNVVGERAKNHSAASTSEMSRFETQTLTSRENLRALTDLPGMWVDEVRRGKIGAKVVRHARYVTFQMAEVAVPRELFRAILARIRRLGSPAAAWVPG